MRQLAAIVNTGVAKAEHTTPHARATLKGKSFHASPWNSVPLSVQIFQISLGAPLSAAAAYGSGADDGDESSGPRREKWRTYRFVWPSSAAELEFHQTRLRRARRRRLCRYGLVMPTLMPAFGSLGRRSRIAIGGAGRRRRCWRLRRRRSDGNGADGSNGHGGKSLPAAGSAAVMALTQRAGRTFAVGVGTSGAFGH